MAMLQFELMAAVPVGAGIAGGQGLQQPASLLGCGGVAWVGTFLVSRWVCDNRV